MASRRESIIARFGTLLNGGGKPAGVPTFVRSRDKAIEASDLPDGTFWPGVDKVQPIRGGGEGAPIAVDPKMIVLRMLDINVAVTAAKDGAVTADEALDPITSWVVKSTVDTPQGWRDAVGALGCSEVQTDFTPDVAEVQVFEALVTMRVYYKARAGDPDAGT